MHVSSVNRHMLLALVGHHGAVQYTGNLHWLSLNSLPSTSVSTWGSFQWPRHGAASDVMRLSCSPCTRPIIKATLWAGLSELEGLVSQQLRQLGSWQPMLRSCLHLLPPTKNTDRPACHIRHSVRPWWWHRSAHLYWSRKFLFLFFCNGFFLGTPRCKQNAPSMTIKVDSFNWQWEAASWKNSVCRNSNSLFQTTSLKVIFKRQMLQPLEKQKLSHCYWSFTSSDLFLHWNLRRPTVSFSVPPP